MSRSRDKRGSINLTALGSAAVIAVYSAGYLRTRSAARKFESGEFDRRPPSTATPAPTAPDSATHALAVPTPMDTVVMVPAKPAAQTRPLVPTASVHVDTTGTVDSVPSAPQAPAPPAPSAPAADTVTAVADSVKRLKDGTYKGWGTSRHGDIEAAVEIKAGRIVNAYITQCLTRYSCDRIAVIIPQVVARQSAEVDFVSGATQSTNAFYYAILEALSKAK
jgi:uncharacterized protein with FMN-binding domain